MLGRDQFSQDESSLGETIVLQLKKRHNECYEEEIVFVAWNCAVVKQILRVLTLLWLEKLFDKHYVIAAKEYLRLSRMQKKKQDQDFV